MLHVADFYDKMDLKHNKAAVRRVYLASDDPSVLPEAQTKCVDLFVSFVWLVLIDEKI